jgi:hypothetical protein
LAAGCIVARVTTVCHGPEATGIRIYAATARYGKATETRCAERGVALPLRQVSGVCSPRASATARGGYSCSVNLSCRRNEVRRMGRSAAPKSLALLPPASATARRGYAWFLPSAGVCPCPNMPGASRCPAQDCSVAPPCKRGYSQGVCIHLDTGRRNEVHRWGVALLLAGLQRCSPLQARLVAGGVHVSVLIGHNFAEMKQLGGGGTQAEEINNFCPTLILLGHYHMIVISRSSKR